MKGHTNLLLQTTCIMWMFGSVYTLTILFYRDENCETMVPSPFQGVPNPLVAPLNRCTMGLNVRIPSFVSFLWFIFSQDSSTKLYIKPIICSSTYPHPLYTYMDANCAQQHLEPNSVHIGACVTQGAPPGSASFMITCSHTATLGADWLFFGLAVGCIMI